MNIKEALKETGKAEAGGTVYVKIKDTGVLCFYYKNSNNHYRNVELMEIFDIDWKPYHSEPVIKPQKAGELWENKEHGYFHVVQCHNLSLMLIHRDFSIAIMDVIHGQNGWERLYPPVGID